MASKKSGRAAGLAALAGLAYMASQDKGGKTAQNRDDADTYTGSRAPADRDDADRYTGSRAPAGSGDFMSEKEPGWATKSAPTSVARPTATRAAVAAPAAASTTNEDAFGNVSLRRAAAAAPAIRAVATPPTNEDAFGNVSTGRAPAAASAVSKRPMSSGTIDYRPDPRAPSIYADEKTFANYRAEQEAGIDKEKYNEFLKKRPGMMERMRVKDQAAAGSAMKKGGKVKKMASGGMTSSASRRGDGIASKGKTRCKMY